MRRLSILGAFLVPLLTLLYHVQADGRFVRTQGLHFVLNGYPFFANGFNAYWLMSMASDPSQRYKVSSVFREASHHGLTVARTWAFSDGGSNALQYSPGSYNEAMFKGLDFVVSEARTYGINLILSLVNNYDSYGGRKQYVQWARNAGQNLGSDDDFFTNPVVKDYYKNHVKTVLTRVNTITGIAYKDDPTIFAWELMNEPRCLSDLSGKTIQSWIQEMAAHVKSIDSNHLLEAGLEGFYSVASSQKQANLGFRLGTDFIANNQIHGIDFATIHSYPDQWMPYTSDQSQLNFMENWLDVHMRDARDVLRKPLLITEFGKSQKNPRYNSYQRNTLFNTVFSKIYESARTGGSAAGGLFWQLLSEGMDAYRDGYEVVLNENPTTTQTITAQSRKLVYLREWYAKVKNIAKLNQANAMREKQQNTASSGEGN